MRRHEDKESSEMREDGASSESSNLSVSINSRDSRTSIISIRSSNDSVSIASRKPSNAPRAPWPMVRLGDVCEIIAGQSPEGSYYTDESCYTEFHQGSKSFGTRELQVSGVYTKKETKIAKPGSLLISVRAPVGDLNITTRRVCIGRGLAALIPNDSLSRDFLWLFLTSATKAVNDAAGAGSCFSSLSRSQLSGLEIPLPSLSEQKKIVARLERKLAAVEKMKKGFEALAETAKQEFKAELKEVFEEISHGGTETRRLGDVLDTGAGGTPLKQHRDYYDGGDIPWLRSGEVCKKDITETELFITAKGMASSSAKLFPKDSVVVAMYGATAGQVGILRIESTTNQAVCAIFPSSKHVPEFLYYQLLGMKEEMVSQAQGGAQPNISQIKIRNLQVCLPPLPDQREVVARIDSAKARAEKLEAKAREGVAVCETMRKAILKEAFE